LPLLSDFSRASQSQEWGAVSLFAKVRRLCFKVTAVKLNFKADLWVWSGENPWHFVTLPKKNVQDLREIARLQPPRGFGSMRVSVNVGTSEWQTSIFPDSKSGSYLLPIKKPIRKKEKLVAGDSVKVIITLID
jgi:hypothetical protein